MTLPANVEGRVANLSDLLDPTVDIGSGSITIDEIQTNNAVLATGQQTDVTTDVLTTVATVPANGIRYITKIICTGEDNGKWDVYIDSVRKMTKRTINRTVDFDFSTPLKLDASSVLDVKVTHFSPDSNATFEAAILGYSPA